MHKIPCEIIQDLLPSYIDKLTSELTNKEVEGHLSECEKCARVLEQMNNPELENAEAEEKEIDFLKTTRRRTQKKLIACIAAVWAVVILLWGIRTYFCGQYVNTDYLMYNLTVSGNELAVAVNSTSNQGIQTVQMNEAEGVVEITVRCVPKSVFYDEKAETKYTASENIRQVWIGNRIVWANGEAISPLTSALYDVYNPYIGNMPSNGKVAGVLNMGLYTGNFTNELQTSEEPYAWKMIFQNDFSANRQAAFEERLQKYAYIYLSQIGNLGEVIYVYQIEGETKTLSVTSEEASAFAGVDIKTVGTDINLLEKLVQKTGLTNVVLGDAGASDDAQADFSNSDSAKDTLTFTVVNFAEDAVYGMHLDVECQGNNGDQSMCTADNRALVSGENINFRFIPQDFQTKPEDGSSALIRLSVVDEAGTTYEVQGEVSADLFWGNSYRLNLSGDAEHGYFLGK